MRVILFLLLIVITIAANSTLEPIFVQRGLSNKLDDALDLCEAAYKTEAAVCAMIIEQEDKDKCQIVSRNDQYMCKQIAMRKNPRQRRKSRSTIFVSDKANYLSVSMIVVGLLSMFYFT